jgi:hypothetical protein
MVFECPSSQREHTVPVTNAIDVEEWRPIDGWPDYAVSNLGRVRSNRKWNWGYRPPRILKPGRRRGYPFVKLYGDDRQQQISIHYLVCVAFHGQKPPDKDEVAHGDSNPGNNAASNLRWATHAENNDDRKRHGTLLVGEQTSSAKLTEQDVKRIAELIASGARDVDIAAKFGASAKSVTGIRTGKSWSWLTGFKAGYHRRGTARSGISSNAKLKTHQVLEILDAPGRSRRELATKFGVTPAYISEIRMRRVWKHLERTTEKCAVQ